MFSDPGAYRDIYGSKANVQKSWHVKIRPKDRTAVSTITCIDKATHKRRRRNLEHAFSNRAVRSAEPFVVEHSDRWSLLLVAGTEDSWSEPRNMTQWADSLIFDMFCDLCSGKTWHEQIQNNSSRHYAVYTVHLYCKTNP